MTPQQPPGGFGRGVGAKSRLVREIASGKIRSGLRVDATHAKASSYGKGPSSLVEESHGSQASRLNELGRQRSEL